MLGAIRQRPPWRPDPSEVARVLEPTVERLADRRHLAWERRVRPWGELDIPYLALDDARLWGATAMVLAEFLTMVGLPPDPGPPPARE